MLIRRIRNWIVDSRIPDKDEKKIGMRGEGRGERWREDGERERRREEKEGVSAFLLQIELKIRVPSFYIPPSLSFPSHFIFRRGEIFKAFGKACPAANGRYR